MGTFVGHALPGSLFLIVSFWWAADVLNYYYRNVAKRKSANLSTSDMKLDFSSCHGKLGQGLFVVSLTVVGMVGEYLTAFDKGPVMCKDNLQHMSMYLFFFFFGLSYLFSYCGASLPLDAPYFTLVLSFFGETLLFFFHLHGRSHLDIHVHTLLIVVTSLCTLCTCFEWLHKRSVLAALGRPFWCCVQGTWFWQVGFILYNPLPNAKKWDEHNHEQIMVITSMFCWHIIAALIWFTFLCFRYSRKYKNIWSVTHTQEATSSKYQQLKIEDDSSVMSD
ncbi:hypothetical protein B4U80_11378 [Leptotrombidium deliense]|uniref:Transmembrane protein 45B-like protein n=1 Tax=Leptotrombidium deliense TaxID=299467 RepID=A0A443S4G2_9ACAR|nr:hypothetical protein B4U80_11378 [Leptotrombidium deliense]